MVDQAALSEKSVLSNERSNGTKVWIISQGSMFILFYSIPALEMQIVVAESLQCIHM